MQQQGGQCPFCQLIENPDQLLKVGETENFFAWLEVNPRARGHTMVVPKEHKESALDFSPQEWNEAMNLTRKVVEKAKKGLDADGASITVNIEEAGGQMLPHAYIQVFPRFQDEETAGTPTGAVFPHREDLQEELQSIQQDMSSINVEFGQEVREAHEDSQRHLEQSAVEKAARRATQAQEDRSEKNRKEQREEPDEVENRETQPSKQEGNKEDEEEEELTGEGHWDGKSFEWR